MKVSDIKLFNCTEQDYSNGNVEASDSNNFTDVGFFLYKPSPMWGNKEDSNSYEHFLDQTKLFQDNRKNFLDLFGKPHFHFKGSEFYFHCWAIDLGTVKVIILTAKDKGTCYEIVTDFKGNKEIPDINTFIDFFKFLMKELPRKDVSIKAKINGVSL